VTSPEPEDVSDVLAALEGGFVEGDWVLVLNRLTGGVLGRGVVRSVHWDRSTGAVRMYSVHMDDMSVELAFPEQVTRAPERGSGRRAR
jgi:hypothetical protein